MKKSLKKENYLERNDIGKIISNWNKVQGLYSRKEWSSVIIRAATAVELSANFVIRKELEGERNLDSDFVNHLLRWANGIQGKFDKLLLPIFKGTDNYNELKKLLKQVQDINKERNSVVHNGQFKRKSTADKIVFESELIINTLVSRYEDYFDLSEIYGKESLKDSKK